MKKRFWKIRKPVTTEEWPHSSIGAFVVNIILKIRHNWAVWMQQQTEKLSAKGKLIMLVIFCAITTTGSIAFIHRSITSNDRINYQVGSIEIPSLPKQEKIGLPDKATMERINRFRNYMDSLAKDHRGIKTYDSILLAHPGLMDSISTLQQLNRQQLKN